jgi:hypothetical protein
MSKRTMGCHLTPRWQHVKIIDALFILAFFGVLAIGHSFHTRIDGADESWYV